MSATQTLEARVKYPSKLPDVSFTARGRCGTLQLSGLAIDSRAGATVNLYAVHSRGEISSNSRISVPGNAQAVTDLANAIYELAQSAPALAACRPGLTPPDEKIVQFAVTRPNNLKAIGEHGSVITTAIVLRVHKTGGAVRMGVFNSRKAEASSVAIDIPYEAPTLLVLADELQRTAAFLRQVISP
jgi:hypothetical protein